MKKLYFSLIIITSITLLSWSGGYTIPASGAPGNTSSCGQSGCHSAGAFDPSMEINLTDLDGNAIERYLPGTEYLINVSISSPAQVPPTGYGFQMVCLDDQANPVNSFMNLPNGIRQFDNGGRQYVVQSMRLPSNTISIPWTAPDATAVTFYSGGIAANGNGGSAGDGATSISTTFEQDDDSTSTEDIPSSLLNAYPNPVNDILNIEGSTNGGFQLVDENGKLILEQTSNKMDVSHLNSGVYFLIANDNDNSPIVKRIIKE